MLRLILASSLAVTISTMAPTMVRSQSTDDAMFLRMAMMQASLIYAADKCRGNVDPNAEAAVATVAQRDPIKMKAAILAALVAINRQSERVGVSQQCRTIIETFGPKGSIMPGAWRPAKR